MLGASGTSVAAPPATRLSASPELRYRIGLWALLALGVGGRVLFDLRTRGNVYDLESLRIVAHALSAAPGHVYTLVNPWPRYRWPYPPGYFPLILLAKSLADATGLQFVHVIRFWPILADAAIAWVVQDHLASQGVSPRARLAAVALVMLGPSFVAISAVHGQIDAVAILPALIALTVWERADGARRAPIAGALIGVGIAIKTVPGLMLLALLPSARDRREAAVLFASAAAVVLVAIGPFLIHDGVHWFHNLNYNGGTGLGGLGLVAQPQLALDWLHVGNTPISSFSLHLLHYSRWIAGASALAVAAVLWRRRVAAPLAAVLMWLAVYAFGVTFFMQYMVWGLPFMLMAGFLWPVLALELLLLAPVLVIYRGVSHAWTANLFYVAPMLLLWAALTTLLVWWLAGGTGRWPARRWRLQATSSR